MDARRPAPSYARFARKRGDAPSTTPPGSRGTEPSGDRTGPRWGLWLAGTAVLAAVGYAALGAASRPDPHYVRAQEIVEHYETGRPEPSRNYNGPAYTQALEELAQVAPRSVSAEPAKEMARDIEDRRRTFAERQRAQAARHAASRQKSEQRQRIEFARREQQLANPVTEFPECDE